MERQEEEEGGRGVKRGGNRGKGWERTGRKEDGKRMRVEGEEMNTSSFKPGREKEKDERNYEEGGGEMKCRGVTKEQRITEKKSSSTLGVRSHLHIDSYL